MFGEVVGGGYYSIPTLVLARGCYFVLATLISKIIQIILAVSESVLRTRTTGESPIGRGGHYILDLMPAGGHGRERRRTARYFIGGYSIPTIALANISQLVMTKLTQFSSGCVHGVLQIVLFTVLGMTQLQVGLPPDGEDRQDPSDNVVQNHYIFDLRPQYGSDIIEMFYDVLENNWPALVPYFRKQHKRSKRKYVLKSGWRPKLVNQGNKKRTKKSLQPTKSINHHSPKIRSSSLHSVCDMDNKSFSHSEEQVGIQMSTRKEDHSDVTERLEIELPMQVTDEDTDIKVSMFETRTCTT